MESTQNKPTEGQPVKLFQSFEEFWPFYLGQHANRTCRWLHVFGTSAGVLVFANGLRTGHWRALFPALVLGYGFSWIGHFFFEKNRPATFTYPRWSFKGDFVMLKLFFTGKLNAELEKYKITWPREPA